MKKVIWLGPLVFLIHDLEEVFWSQKWIEKNSFLFDGTVFETIINHMGYRPLKFGFVVALVTILYGILAYVATRQIKVGTSMNLYVATLLLLFFNVFTHVGQTVFLGMYTPGVVTAVIIVCPYTIYAFQKLKVNNVLTKVTWRTSPYMSMGMIFIIFGLMFLIRL